MSAADEYRLLAMTVPFREIVKGLDIPEDARPVLVWLEEHGYGDVGDHIDAALHMTRRDRERQYVGWVAPTVRFEWLLHYVALCGPAHLQWPVRPQGLAPWLTEKALAEFEKLNRRADHEDARTVAAFWGALLGTAGVRPNTYTPQSPLHEYPIWKALSILEKLHRQGYDIFYPDFFRQYATRGLSEQAIEAATELRWKQ